MTGYQLKTRWIHFWTARHWRGHGIHSPFLYGFVRGVVLRVPRKEWTRVIFERYGTQQVRLLPEPFTDRREHEMFEAWVAAHPSAVVELPGLIVVFLDPALQPQRFRVRG